MEAEGSSERTPLLNSSSNNPSSQPPPRMPASDSPDKLPQGRASPDPPTTRRSRLEQISLPVYILIMCFALSSWIDINGLWVEIPLLVNELPEGWNLPSYIIVIIQFANVGPLVYTLLVRRWPHRVKEWPAVYVIITIGALSCLALVFFWDHTSVINGSEHSTGLFTLTFFLALVDCTSSVVYLPYMALLKPQYMTSFYIGEGLSGLIPGLVGLMQGVGGDPDCVNTSVIIENTTTGINETEWVIIPHYQDPNFSIEVFFFFLFLMILTSAFAFTCVHFMPFAKRERVDPIGFYEIEVKKNVPENSVGNGSVGVYTTRSEQRISADYQIATTSGDGPPVYEGNVAGVNREQICRGDSGVDGYESFYKTEDDMVDKSTVGLTNTVVNPSSLTRVQFIYLLVLTAWINGLTNGVLPSTQSYTCLPYGGLVYSLTVRLSTVANPLACFCALFVPIPSITAVSVLTLLGSVLSAYQLALAGLSPSPPLQGEVIGEFLVVFSAVLLTAFFTFSKVAIASILRNEGGRTALIWCGGVTQVGSFIGAIIIFIIVNVLHLLESMPPCPV